MNYFLDPKYPETLLLSRFDSEIIRFNSGHKNEFKSIIKEFHKFNELIELKQVIKRNSFLYACMIYTLEKKEEHLFIGFGKKHGNGSDISHIYHIIGESDSIYMTAEEVISYYIATAIPSTETIVFHNHVSNYYNKKPLPSSHDRDFLINSFIQPLHLTRFLVDNTVGVKLFLSENGKVVRIKAPTISTILYMLNNRR